MVPHGTTWYHMVPHGTNIYDVTVMCSGTVSSESDTQSREPGFKSSAPGSNLE